MPIIVNGLMMPEELIMQEAERLGRDPGFARIHDSKERAQRLRAAGEHSAINHMLLDHAAATDARPIDASLVEQEVERQKAAGGSRSAFDDTELRLHIERALRIGRITREFAAGAQKPTSEEIESFYRENRENFGTPGSFHAAHIVCHVNETHPEEQARQLIETAFAELESGQDFATVADRHSDCKGNGGDLGTFAKGEMVQEFEDSIANLEVGGRTAIFSTPFGFHIAELRAKTTSGPAELEDVRADIEKVMTAMREHEHFLKGIETLRQRAEIRWAPL